MNGMVPGLLHAGNYAAAALAEGGEGCRNHRRRYSGAKMKATPVNDMYNTDVKIREDGRVCMRCICGRSRRWPSSKYPYDYCKEVVSPA